VTGAFRLDGQVAVVTGALGRLGGVWSRALLDAGARVAALDRPGPEPDAAFAGLMRERELRLYRADVRERGALLAARDAIRAELGVPAILVNNAGIDQPPSAGAGSWPLPEVPWEASRELLEVNALGAFQVAQVFGAEMLREKTGSIINVGSLYASVSPDARFYDHLAADPPFLKPPFYGASKAALVNLTRYLATHWGPSGVRVNALSPGGVLGGQDAEFQRKFCARVPLGRMAEEQDLVGPLLFLASAASRYVTGIELRVDGGYTAW